MEIVVNDCSEIQYLLNESSFCLSVQDQRVGEPENHRSSSRQSAGPAVRHVRGATGSTPAKQQTGQRLRLVSCTRTPFHSLRVDDTAVYFDRRFHEDIPSHVRKLIAV